MRAQKQSRFLIAKPFLYQYICYCIVLKELSENLINLACCLPLNWFYFDFLTTHTSLSFLAINGIRSITSKHRFFHLCRLFSGGKNCNEIGKRERENELVLYISCYEINDGYLMWKGSWPPRKEIKEGGCDKSWRESIWTRLIEGESN